jgi:hypothetical protein
METLRRCLCHARCAALASGAAGSTYRLSVADNAREEVELLNSDG